MKHAALALAIVLAVTGAAARGHAQGSPGAPAPSGGPPPTQAPAPAEAQAEARERFRRALELAEDGDFDSALIELRRAYELAPTYRILYNVALVYQQLKDYARALDTFERYLAEGGADIDEDRAEAVRTRMERLRGRVAYVVVKTAEPGAEIAIDDRIVGRTPLVHSLRVNSGQRRVTAKLAGRPVEARVVELAGGESREVQFDLRPAVVRIAAEPTRAAVWIGWSSAAVLAAGAAVTGILSLDAKAEHEEQIDKLGVTRGELNDTRTRMDALALTTDVLAGAALVAAGVSLYLTLEPSRPRPEEAPPGAALEIYTTGSGAGVRYGF